MAAVSQPVPSGRLCHVQGMTDAGRAVVAPMVLRAWDDFLALVDQVDLQAPSRLPGWRVHEVCVHLGAWPEHDALAGVLASARQQRLDRLPDSDEINARLVETYRGASRDEVVGALVLARDNAATYFAESDESLDSALTGSVVGPLPVLSVLLGGTYELAVHALDLASAGVGPPSDELLLTGLGALAEVTGALAARVGVHGRAALHSPVGGWAFAAEAAGWTVERLGVEQPRGTAVEGDVAALLDLSAGRINPVVAITRGHLRVHDLPGLLRLAPIVESVPGLPGGPVLRVAGRTLAHVPRLPRWRRPGG
jgi:uncharacterized protein (TIGR03083 family)